MVEANTHELKGREPVLVPGEVPVAYWAQPSRGVELAGYGVAARSSVPKGLLLAGEGPVGIHHRRGPRPPGPWMGGFAFAPERAPQRGWAGFPSSGWVLPALLRWRVGARRYETRYEGGPVLPARVGGALAPEPPLGRRAFVELVSLALEAISAGRFEKVVLARAMDLPRGHLALGDLLGRLRRANPRSTTYLWRAADGSAFLGASPERLVRVHDRTLETEAVAGTAPLAAGRRWKGRAKEQLEQALVLDGLRAVLGPLSERVEVTSGRRPVVFGRLQHLRTRIRARLREGVNPTSVLSALHPTAAVGGAPREQALRFLRRHERLERGWYAGGLGLWGEHGGELVVGLRGALWLEDRVRAFVGAGIVEGSDPNNEWRETELKGQVMRGAVEGLHAG